MDKNNRLFSLIGFLLCFSFFFSITTDLIMPKWKGKDENYRRTYSFYKLPKNSIDVIFIGASTLRNGVSPLTMWSEYGITSYVRATSAQDPMISYFYLLESLKYQTPKVVVLDGGGLFGNYDVDKAEPSLRKSVDPLRFSILKLRLIFEILSQSETQSLPNYLFPLLRYHSRWKEVNQEDIFYLFKDHYDPYRGQYVVLNKESFEIPEDFMNPGNEVAEYSHRSIEYHQKIVDLCKKKGIDVVYLSFPRTQRSNYSTHLGILQFAEKNNLIYLDYALPELYSKVGFDSSTDLDDPNHLNAFGAYKFSKDLGYVLRTQFDLSDKRSFVQYEQWDIDSNLLYSQLEIN